METTEALIFKYQKMHKAGKDTSDIFQQMKIRYIKIGYNILPKYVYKFHYKEDVMAEIDMHLHLAIINFDLKRKLKFTTYVFPWMQKAVFKYLSNKTRLIRFPEHKAGKIPENVIVRRMGKTPMQHPQSFARSKNTIDIILINRSAEKLTSLEFDILNLHIEGYNFREIKTKLRLKCSKQYIHSIFKASIKKLNTDLLS